MEYLFFSASADYVKERAVAERCHLDDILTEPVGSKL